jgi:hypothetical protein
MLLTIFLTLAIILLTVILLPILLPVAGIVLAIVLLFGLPPLVLGGIGMVVLASALIYWMHEGWLRSARDKALQAYNRRLAEREVAFQRAVAETRPLGDRQDPEAVALRAAAFAEYVRLSAALRKTR